MPIGNVDASIPLQTVVPNPQNQISGFLDLGRKKLELQKAQDTYAADVAQRKAESSSAQTAADLARQTLAPKVSSAISAADTAQTGAQSAKYKLTKEQTDLGYQLSSGLVADPAFDPNNPNSDRQIELFNDAESRMIKSGVAPSLAHKVFGPYKDLAANDPTQTKQRLANSISQSDSVQGQAAQNLVPVSSQQGVSTDIQGNQAVYRKDRFGNVLPPTALPSAPVPATIPNVPANPPALNATAPVTSLPPGTNGLDKPLTDERLASKAAFANAPAQRQANSEILAELPKVTTGVLGPGLNRLFSKLGARFDTAEQRASAYDLLGKYMERNVLQQAAAMGPQTNANIEANARALGSPAYNPSAIAEVTKLNDAMSAGVQAYHPGMEKRIAANPQEGVRAKNQYDIDWGANFNPDIFLMYNAAQSGDKAMVDKIAQKYADPKAMSEFKQKAHNLESLSKYGVIR